MPFPRPRPQIVDAADPATPVPSPSAPPQASASAAPPRTPPEPVRDREQGRDPVPDAGVPQEAGEGAAESGGSWALVKACQAGDMQAFSELFDRYHEIVFRYVLFRMGDRTLAEDITQETFVRALRRIGSVSYQGRDIGAWFVTIARNLIFDHVKSSRYRLESTTAEIIELSPSTGGPEQQVLDNATNEELLRCIAKLNPDQQECIQLRFLQGLSVAETAQLMDRNEGAVKALQHRAVRRLAQLLPDGLR
ncbi:sigma-70 family RNA polymerase sigma factor [Pseudonocardia bannensis]|uniref:sigma-70 family RNA polymerase sigma factor n=1 Tax=Pseudonocardia bannensis TaxID=630973 RepID=UPI001B7D176D